MRQEVKNRLETFRETYENHPEWQKYQKNFPPIYTYDDFKQAINDGKFHALIGMIFKIDDYGKFSRAWVAGDFSYEYPDYKGNTFFATCYFPSGGKHSGILFLVSKLATGRKGETDLKYICIRSPNLSQSRPYNSVFDLSDY